MASPYAFTEDELAMMQMDYKKPKAKKWFVAKKRNGVERLDNVNNLFIHSIVLCRNTLHERSTVASKNKQRMSTEVAVFL